VGRRLARIYEKLEEVIQTYQPAEAGVESLFFAKNISSAMPVAQAKGVILFLLESHGIPVSEYPPQAIKQAIVGRGRAEKHQVQELLRVLLGLKEVPRPDHAADALAAAICHYNHQHVKSIIKEKYI
jgi:crossover junction endodeoxyribonuclease RuvC